MYSGCAFLVSTAFYGILAARALAYFERTHPRSDWWRAKALDRTIDVINFVNAVAATVLSSWVLVTLEHAERTDVHGRKPSELAGWTVESVCGYIIAELSVILLSRYRLTYEYWRLALDSYRWMVVFHTVALVGLTSVTLLDVGYPLAMWVVWSELTSVFLGVESFLEASAISRTHAKAYSVLEASGTLVFVFQRVVVFLCLLWLCWNQFTWKLTFVVQLAVLVTGTVINTGLAVDRIAENARTWYW